LQHNLYGLQDALS